MTADLFSDAEADEILAARDREISKLRDRISIMSSEQGQREKDIRAAAKRQAWDDVLFNVGLYVKSKAVGELSTLLHALESLPAKPSAFDLNYVRTVAGDIHHWLIKLDIEPEGSYVAELKRLRSALNEQGQRLHAEGEQIVGEKCRCAGCELIRAAYGDEPAAALSSSDSTEGAN